MSQYFTPRLFTLAQASALLPVIEPLMRSLQAAAQQARAIQQELDRLAGPPVRTNGHQLAAETRSRELRQQLEEAARKLEEAMREVQSYGCEVKDPLTGLLDFRSLRDDRVVYLCWKLGEPDIAFWHELDAGFAGRQPL